MEKPMAVTEAECDELVTLAREQQRVLAVGHEFRISTLWGRVKEMIDQDAIGEPQYALIELWRRPYRLGADGWRYDIERVGNWILEEPIHFFDLARWYMSAAGDPTSVFAQANSRQPGHPELQDNFSAIVTFRSGAYAVISQTLSAYEHHQTVKITGRRGALWATWSGAMDRTLHPTFSLTHFDGTEPRKIPIHAPSGEVFELANQISAVAVAARTGSPVPASGEDGRWSTRMCLRAAESARTGAVVSFA
jgi:myo-inositol 2-dehydrogenase / D-chiro-inositol 1-dehydrogenase